MYKKYIGYCLMVQAIWLCALFSIRTVQVGEIMSASTESVRAAVAVQKEPDIQITDQERLQEISSGQRVVEYGLLQDATDSIYMEEVLSNHGMTWDDYDTLTRIVEAEAGGEDENGKMLVACVVLNRVADDAFPDTVQEVVFQKSHGVTQFTPISDGRFYRVKVSETTKEAVWRVLSGEDISQGALYFVSRKGADPDRMAWFDKHLTFLFAYGGHEFFL